MFHLRKWVRKGGWGSEREKKDMMHYVVYREALLAITA